MEPDNKRSGHVSVFLVSFNHYTLGGGEIQRDLTQLFTPTGLQNKSLSLTYNISSFLLTDS